tara:strand:- start:310 stop:684 length:375 start_codon:yes stop_codon:yes gene_type:complete
MSLPSDNKDDMPSDNKDDIIEETIIDDDVEKEATVKKFKKKKRSRKKKSLTKFCKTCGQDILQNEIRDMFMFQDTYHQLQAKDYCEQHELVYSNHKCKPCWCGDCGYLTKYEIIIDWEKKNKKW